MVLQLFIFTKNFSNNSLLKLKAHGNGQLNLFDQDKCKHRARIQSVAIVVLTWQSKTTFLSGHNKQQVVL